MIVCPDADESDIFSLMLLTRRRFLAHSSLVTAASSLLPGSLSAQTGAPGGAPDAYAKPKPDLDGAYKPTWASIRDQHRTPTWFNQAKFGILIHWGFYSIPARLASPTQHSKPISMP
jgi:alpha-L-fucosidase